jgi:hypothetical protein
MQATLVRPVTTEPAQALAELFVAPPAQRRTARIDIVEEWGVQSFPASDPPANW